MAPPTSPPVVAVLDSDPDTTEMIKTWLEFHGFIAAIGNLVEFRLGKSSLLQFLEQTAPDVIVYDLGVPYETNYGFLQKVSAEPAFARSALVITTTNAAVVRTLFGVEAIEILGKPYDLNMLIQAIRTASNGNGIESQPTVERRRGERRQGDRRAGIDRRSPEVPLH